MADVSTGTRVFSRGSAVLDYWLVHAEGLTVEPLGVRVEEVVVVPPDGRAEALIVRSRMTRRRKAIPAGSIAAVEPSAGQLLLEEGDEAGRHLHAPRLSSEQLAAARAGAERGGRFAGALVAQAARSTRAGTVAAVAWLRPRAARVRAAGVQTTRVAGTQTARGAAWLMPRAVDAARTAAAMAVRLTLMASVLVARGVARTARELERATAAAAQRGRASLDARRARREQPPD